MRVATVLILSALFFATHSFNVSPTANIILKIPPNKFTNKNRSSYFGFSLNLRKTHILIGAPRANSSLPSQSKIEEPGMIYKCTFDEKCEMFVMDAQGDSYVGENVNLTYSLDTEYKDNRYLGFSMDGRDTEDDSFVACAPKDLTLRYKNAPFMFGACYFTDNTKVKNPKVVKVSNFREQEKSLVKNKTPRNSLYQYAESGFSVHITEEKDKDRKELLLGCPGFQNWLGTINRFKTSEVSNSITNKGIIAATNKHKSLKNNDYFGYAINSGKFLEPQNYLTQYVASAPRKGYNGSVIIFSTISSRNFMSSNYTLKHSQFGSYFGYALLCDDFNGDSKIDIAVSAPFYSENEYGDIGAVYIYFNQATDGKTLNFSEPLLLTSNDKESFSQFGTALGKIGDINGDGFNDLAISDNIGSVYIYNGGSKGLRFSQKIKASAFSISRGIDIDGNGYNDIAVGAPNSDEVLIYKSFPVIKIETTLNYSTNELDLTDKISVKACVTFHSKTRLNHKVDLSTKLFINEIETVKNVGTFKQVQTLSQDKFDCIPQEIEIIFKDPKTKLVLIQKPIKMKFTFELVNHPYNGKKFCEKCVAIDPLDSKEVSLIYTGCKNNICRPNLKLEGSAVEIKGRLIVGALKDISLIYNVSNTGDSAYSPLFTMLIPKHVSFAKIPSACKNDKSDEIICEINSGIYLNKGDNIQFNITLDVTKVQGGLLDISAKVSSKGFEVDELDNVANLTFTFEERSLIGVNSKTSLDYINVMDKEEQNIEYTYNIFNHGESPVVKFKFDVFIPQKLITINDKVEITKIERIGYTYGSESFGVNFTTVDKNTPWSYNEGQTILIDCNQVYIECIKAEITILNFEPSTENAIDTLLNFTILTKAIDEIIDQPKYKILFKTKFFSTQINETLRSLKIIEKESVITLFNEKEEDTPLWIYLVSIIVGVLLFAILIFVLYKLGFFTRKIKQELKQKKRETMMELDFNNLNFQSDENLVN